jgi:hypothetical protein
MLTTGSHRLYRPHRRVRGGAGRPHGLVGSAQPDALQRRRGIARCDTAPAAAAAPGSEPDTQQLWQQLCDIKRCVRAWSQQHARLHGAAGSLVLGAPA